MDETDSTSVYLYDGHFIMCEPKRVKVCNN